MTDLLIQMGAAGGCAFILRLAIDAYYLHKLNEMDARNPPAAPKQRPAPVPRSWLN